MNATRDGPLKIGIPVIDSFSGYLGVIAILSALRTRDASGAKTGGGQNIDVAMLDAALKIMGTAASVWSYTGTSPQGTGNRGFRLVATAEYYATAEGWIALAAIDAGADVVVGHHAHIVRRIELHHGKPVFHGLGNGVVVTHALSPAQDHPARAEWAQRRKQMFGFEPDPACPLAPFHPEAVNGMIGRVLWHEDGRLECGFLATWSEPPGRPVPAGAKAGEVADYVGAITTRAGLPPLHIEEAGEGRFAIS